MEDDNGSVDKLLRLLEDRQRKHGRIPDRQQVIQWAGEYAHNFGRSLDESLRHFIAIGAITNGSAVKFLDYE